MNLNSLEEQAFLKRITAIVEANLSNEQFGVNEMAAKAGMSRSQIHRRLKSCCNKSVSQFIREVRLEKAKEFLVEGNLTVSEIAYEVGFGSPSYFIKSFHDYFGYPPGEAKHQNQQNDFSENEVQTQSAKKKFYTKRQKYISSILVLIVFLFTLLIFNIFPFSSFVNHVGKTILIDELENLSSDKSNPYFAKGLTNTIRSQLGKISRVKVIAGPTAEQFKDSTLSVIEIARKVNANYILYGSTQLQNNDVLINLVLLDVRKGVTLWSENYARNIDDLFVTQLDIAKNVAENLQTILSPKEMEQIKKLQPKNFEAYNNYLMGQYLCLKRDSFSIQRGIEYFNKAIGIDSSYTFAYAGLADAYYAFAFTGTVERSAGYDNAYKMAEKALEKDPNLAEAYAVLGSVSYFGYWQWEKARKFFKKAVEIDSNCMVAHLYYSSFLDIVDEPDKAINHVNKAIELEPYLTMPYIMKGIYYRNEKKFAESTDVYKRLLELDPKRWQTYNIIFLNYIFLKDEASALETLVKVFSFRPGFQKYKNKVYPFYETLGMNGVLKLYLEAIQKEHKNACPAEMYAKLGMKTEALDCLEQRCREKDGTVPRIIRIPEYESLYSEPRFQVLVDSMNLRPYFPKPPK